jgi:CHAT domain-containing protein/Tfp pilus assembly protein PilF
VRFSRLFLHLALHGAAALLASGAPALEDTVLTPGPPGEARIAAGELHGYRIDAGAAPATGWLRVFAEERGADIALDLRSPDGTILLTVDSPNSRFGLESMLFRPELPGSYRVEVRIAQVRVPGAYALGLETLEEKPGDPRIAAERLATEASKRYAEDTREGREAALALYRQALPLWHDLGRRREEWHTLYAIAELLRGTGDFRQALEVLTRALDAQRALADPRQEARTLQEMGFAHFSLGDVEAARELYQKALDLWKLAPDPYGEALVLNNLGLTWQARGDLRTAFGYYERALPLLRQAGDPRSEAILANNLGGLLRDLGEPGEALARFQEVLARQRALGDRREEATVLGNLAQVHWDAGRYDEALEENRQALEIFRREGDVRGESRLLSSLGLLYRFLGDSARAAEHLEASLELRRRTGDRAGEAITLHNLALAVLDAGDPARAAALFQQALEIQRALGDRRAEAITLFTLGTLDVEAGRTAQGTRSIDRSFELLRPLEDRRSLCEALRRGGEARAASGLLEPAREMLGESLALCRAVADTPRELRVLVALARVERSLGNPGAAEELVDTALERIESTRASLASPDLRASYLSRQLAAYELAIDLQMDAHRREPAAGHDRMALALGERARARSLLDLLEESGAEIRRGIDPALGERRRLLEQRLEAKARRRLAQVNSPRDTVRRQTLDEELRSVVADLETVDAEIRRRNPRYADLVRPRPLDTAAIQALLDEETLLLVYSLGEDRSFLWAVSRSALESFELPPRRVVEAAAREVHTAWKVFDLRSRQEDEAAAARLSRLVLSPAAGLLGGRRLAIVADGALHYVPFGALPRPAAPGDAADRPPEPLLVRHEIVSLPSASFLSVHRQLLAGRQIRLVGDPAAPRTVAVLADPVFRADDPRLHRSGPASGVPAVNRVAGAAEIARLAWSRAEAESIARLAGAEHTLVATDFAASLDTLTSREVGESGVLHLATHGVVDAEHPALSGLVLSLVDSGGREQPGFLSLAETYNLDLTADLVVLSGCETALGKDVRGEGVIGLARGFLYAGAARVMASLWRVQDRSTAELMRRFYTALLPGGLRPPAALRQAQLEMLRESRWSDPYYWAGFALYGEWR